MSILVNVRPRDESISKPLILVRAPSRSTFPGHHPLPTSYTPFSAIRVQTSLRMAQIFFR